MGSQAIDVNLKQNKTFVHIDDSHLSGLSNDSCVSSPARLQNLFCSDALGFLISHCRKNNITSKIEFFGSGKRYHRSCQATLHVRRAPTIDLTISHVALQRIAIITQQSNGVGMSIEH